MAEIGLEVPVGIIPLGTGNVRTLSFVRPLLIEIGSCSHIGLGTRI